VNSAPIYQPTAPTFDTETCPKCRGACLVVRGTPSPEGHKYSKLVTCSTCDGHGQVDLQRCEECSGDGEVSIQPRNVGPGTTDGGPVRVRCNRCRGQRYTVVPVRRRATA